MSAKGCVAGPCAGIPGPIVVEAVGDVRPGVAPPLPGTRMRGRSLWAAGGGPQRPFTAANGPVLHHVGAMIKVTVRVDVERHVQDEAAGRLAPLVPNPTTVALIEATRRGEVVELGTPAEAIAELNRDD